MEVNLDMWKLATNSIVSFCYITYKRKGWMNIVSVGGDTLDVVWKVMAI